MKSEQTILDYLYDALTDTKENIKDATEFPDSYGSGYAWGRYDAVVELIEWITGEGPNCGQTDET